MSKELVISAAPHETRVALVEDGQLCEIYIEREKEFALVGSIYKGRVTRVLPGMQSAFVEIGLDSDAFLYVSDFLENLEDYDHIVTTVEGKVERMEQQGGQVFVPASAETATVQPPEVSPATSSEAGVSAEPAAGEVLRSAPAPPAPTAERPQAPRYAGHDRRPSGYGREQGGRDRWKHRGGRGRRHGRELPPSKYAPPRPREFGPRPTEEEPILLPGESLAKYKGRIPPVPVAPPATPLEEQAPAVPSPQQEPTAMPGEASVAPHVEPFAEERRAGGALPESLYVAEPPLPVAEPVPGAEELATSLPEEPSSAETIEAGFEGPAAGAAPELTADAGAEELRVARAEGELTDDEVNTLAEQLAEAKHEEAQLAAEESEVGEEEEASQAEEPGAESYEAHEPQEEAAALEAAGEPAPAETAEAEAGAAPVEPAEKVETPPSAARIQEPPRAQLQRPMRRGGRHRGGHFARRHEHRPAPRRPQLISEVLKSNQEIIVQIAKEPLGRKGARITSHVALPGRYLVYMPTVDHIGVSRKIASADERARLRRLVGEAKGTFPGGFIVRTAAEGVSDQEIRSDVEFLGRTWGDIRARSEQRKAPALLHRDLNLVERILRDYLSEDYTAIWVDNEEEYAKVVEFVGRFQPNLVSRVKLYTKETPLFEEFGIQQELDKALRPKVWLKSGGYIVINHTEALVAIDVNTGKYVGRGSTRLEDTIVKTNLEAVKEIVRQIRLRDLGGIIVVDFIDMEERRNREKVMGALDEALRADRAPSKVLAFNEFGLVAITRKRTKQALERVLSQPCPYCSGSGMVKSVPTICYEIQSEARKMAAELDSQSITLRVNPEIAKALKTRESALVEELEQNTRKSVIIQADPTLHWEQYDIY